MSDLPEASFDVVVLGYGFAGAMAAIAAHDAGASVALFEKAQHFGGNSILSGGSAVCGQAVEPTLAYLRRTSGGATGDDLLQIFAAGMVRLPHLLEALAREYGFATAVDRRGGTYPFPGSEQLFNLHVSRNPGFQGFSWLRGAKAGATLFHVVAQHVAARGIATFFATPAVRLVQNEAGAVVGVRVRRAGREVEVAARRGVILATGGFEQNPDLMRQVLPLPEVIAMSPLTHTGDGLLMAQKVGAALWHLWHVHGGYGFRISGLPVALRHGFPGFRDPSRPMPWIAVDRGGCRFMNEYPPAPQDTPIRALEYYDADLQDFPRVPCWLVFDDVGRRLGPIAYPILSDPAVSFSWSQDNLAEIENGWVLRAETVAELAREIAVPADALAQTVALWNQAVDQGEDRRYGRPPGSMMPLRHPPFYAIAAWPVVTNTQGGPVHDVRQRVLDPFGQPIGGLYAAGELGSIFGHLYMLGGNLSECFIGGEIAGREAAAEPCRR